MATPRRPAATAADETPERDGRIFVVASLAFLVVLLGVLLVVSPMLQDRMGLTSTRPFPTPAEATQVSLVGEGDLAGTDLRATVTWDAGGVCAEVTDSAGQTFRTCAVPDPLRPIWAIDAPDDAADGYLLVATPPDVVSIEGRTTDGEVFAALTQARELPAAWALLPLPAGAVVDRMTAFNVEGGDVGGARCGVEDAPTDGPDALAGGCLVPRED